MTLFQVVAEKATEALNLVSGLNWQRTGILIGMLWTAGELVPIASSITFPRLRYHGVTYWAFQLITATFVLVISLNIIAGLVSFVANVDLTWMVASLTTLLVLSVGLFVYQELRERGTFKVGNLVRLCVMPLLPSVTLSALEKVGVLRAMQALH